MATDRVKIIFETKGVKQANDKIKRLGNTAKKARNPVLALGKALAAIVSVAVIKNILDTVVAFDRIQKTLEAVGGSAFIAGENFKFLVATSLRLGFDIEKLALSFARLSAATRNTRLEGRETKEVFLGIVEASRTLQLSSIDTENALRAVQQIISKGVVTMEEMRRQLGDNLPGAFQTAARAMGLTQAAFVELVTSGQLTANEFIPKFAAQLRKEALKGLDVSTKTLAASIGRLVTQFKLFKVAIGKSGFADIAARGIELLSKAIAFFLKVIEGDRTKKFFRGLNQVMEITVRIAKFTLPTALTVLGLAFDGIVATLEGVILTFKLLGLVAVGVFNTIGQVAKNFFTVVSAFVKAIIAGDSLTETVTKVTKAIDGLKPVMDVIKESLKDIKDAWKDFFNPPEVTVTEVIKEVIEELDFLAIALGLIKEDLAAILRTSGANDLFEEIAGAGKAISKMEALRDTLINVREAFLEDLEGKEGPTFLNIDSRSPATLETLAQLEDVKRRIIQANEDIGDASLSFSKKIQQVLSKDPQFIANKEADKLIKKMEKQRDQLEKSLRKVSTSSLASSLREEKIDLSANLFIDDKLLKAKLSKGALDGLRGIIKGIEDENIGKKITERTFGGIVESADRKRKAIQDIFSQFDLDPAIKTQLEKEIFGKSQALTVQLKDAIADLRGEINALIIPGGGEIAKLAITQNTIEELRDLNQKYKDLKGTTGAFTEEQLKAATASVRLKEKLALAKVGINEIETAYQNLDIEQKKFVDAFVAQGLAFKDTMGDMVTAALTGTGSIKDIFKGFIDQLIAEVVRLAVIAPLLKLITGGASGGGFGGFLKSLGTTIFGAAHGADFIVGGGGGTDSQFIPLAVTPGERVTIQTPTQQARQASGRGGDVIVTINIDGNGNTTQVAQTGNDPDSQARELASMVVDIIQKQKRPGGVLSETT